MKTIIELLLAIIFGMSLSDLGIHYNNWLFWLITIPIDTLIVISVENIRK